MSLVKRWIWLSSAFQSAPLREGRFEKLKRCDTALVVSIRAPAGGAIAPSAAAGTMETVSIRAPAGGAIASPKRQGRWQCGFNPRPCGRGDRALAGSQGLLMVSIRAPAGGAI